VTHEGHTARKFAHYRLEVQRRDGDGWTTVFENPHGGGDDVMEVARRALRYDWPARVGTDNAWELRRKGLAGIAETHRLVVTPHPTFSPGAPSLTATVGEVLLSAVTKQAADLRAAKTAEAEALAAYRKARSARRYDEYQVKERVELAQLAGVPDTSIGRARRAGSRGGGRR
jgi:hypothetical protein